MQAPVYPGSVEPTPAGAGAIVAPPPKSEEKEEKKIDINVWELSIDKFIDFVLIFVGLYAAIAVQRWQDDAKEREDYLKLLGDFRGELVANRDERKSLEKDIGSIDDRAEGKVLGPMEKNFARFKKEATEAEELLGCLSLAMGVTQKGSPSAEQAAKLQTCAPIIEAATKQADAKRDDFKPVNLTPFYRDEVQQIYLAGGIKGFENKDLAVQIGQTYTDADKVEKLVQEIEKIYNDNFIDKEGDVRALVAELEDAIPQGEDISSEQAGRLQVQLAKSERDVRMHRYSMEKVHGILESKVKRLKEVVASMDTKIGKAAEAIDAELSKSK